MSKVDFRYNCMRKKLSLASRLMALVVCFALLCAFLPPLVSYAGMPEKKKVRVGWYESTYCYYDANGKRDGLAYEYQQRIAAYTNWEYEYVEGNWDELYHMLENGEIDLLSDVSYKKERAGQVLFPSMPMGSETYYMYIVAGNTKLDPSDISTFENATIGAVPDSVPKELLEKWAQDNGITIEIPDLSGYTIKESFDKLKNGELDAYIYFDAMGNDEVCLPVFDIGESDYYFAVNKERPDLLNDLNQAIFRIRNEDPHYNQRLYERYIFPVSTSTFLTESELRWLQDNGPIRIGYRDDYLPFCAQKDGELYGAFADYIKYAGTCMKNGHITFEPVAYETTEDALNGLKNGEVDAVFPLFLSPSDCDETDILLTNPIMRTEVYATVSDRAKDIFSSDDTRVALIKGNINFDSFIKEKFPKWEITYYDTLEECYKSTADGNTDCAMVASYRLNRTEVLRRRYDLSLRTTAQDVIFSIGVNRDDIDLFSILNKTANVGTEHKVEGYFYKYYAGEEKITFRDFLKDNYKSVLLVLAIVLLVILILLLLALRSDKRANERQELISETERDPVTGLYTRNFFFAYADRMYKEHPAEKRDAIVLNVEQFHMINALYGWEFGDRVLKTIGDEITAFLRENDGIACRAMADRFNIYCRHTDDYQVLFDRTQKKLDNIAEDVVILLRMGVMPWQKDIGPVQLLDRARTACAMTKSGHHSRLIVFSEEMRKKELEEQMLLNDIRRGLENHEFKVYYQPKYDIQVDPPVLKSAEALIRWEHSELGMISPGVFINLFEKNNLIGLLDKYVWSEVARQIAAWKEKYGVSYPISVNLSRIDVFDPELEGVLDKITQDNGLSRDLLHLELTESAYTGNKDQIIKVIGSLRDKGYIIEMDDFGTGYSSLNMLTSMPIDILKLDMGFIRNIGKEEKDSRMVELILDIARNLKLTVVAEGVETQMQLDFLKERGCDLVQGYYFSKALPADEFEKKAFN